MHSNLHGCNGWGVILTINEATAQLILLLILQLGHLPPLRWLKTVRPCTPKVSASSSELREICNRFVAIAARWLPSSIVLSRRMYTIAAPRVEVS